MFENTVMRAFKRYNSYVFTADVSNESTWEAKVITYGNFQCLAICRVMDIVSGCIPILNLPKTIMHKSLLFDDTSVIVANTSF